MHIQKYEAACLFSVSGFSLIYVMLFNTDLKQPYNAVKTYPCLHPAGSDVLTCRLLQPSAHALAAESSQSTELPAWQQNTITDKDFYYFYLILFQLQPWTKGSPTLKDAPIRSAAVSLRDSNY